MEKKYRLQIDFSDSAYNELGDLQRLLDARSKTEVIRTALGLLRWALTTLGSGGKIIVERPSGDQREVVFNFLPAQVRDGNQSSRVGPRDASG